MLPTLDLLCPASPTLRTSPIVADAPPAPRLQSLLLVVSARSTQLTDGRWHFVIESSDGTPLIEAEDEEFGDLNRLTLLATVRGLEAIDGGADVTLLSHNRYLIRSLTDSLPRWRRNDFVWDHFGRRVEVQHADLWRRIDRALHIHQVQACLLTTRRISQPAIAKESSPAEKSLRIDGATTSVPAPHFAHRSPVRTESDMLGSTDRLRDWLLQCATSAPSAHRD